MRARPIAAEDGRTREAPAPSLNGALRSKYIQYILNKRATCWHVLYARAEPVSSRRTETRLKYQRWLFCQCYDYLKSVRTGSVWNWFAIVRRVERLSRVNLARKYNAAEDTRGETANCESGIIRARDPLSTLFLSFFLSFSFSFSFCLRSFSICFPPHLSSISFLSLSVLFPFSVSSFVFRTRFLQSFSLSLSRTPRPFSLSLSLPLSVSLSFAPTSSRGVSACSIGSWAGTHTGGGGRSSSSRDFEPHTRARARHSRSHASFEHKTEPRSFGCLAEGKFCFFTRLPVERKACASEPRWFGNGQGRFEKPRADHVNFAERRDISTASETSRRWTDESLSFRWKYLSCLVNDVWDSRISYKYSFKCRKLVLVISSYFSRDFFFFFNSFPFSLSLFSLSFSLSFFSFDSDSDIFVTSSLLSRLLLPRSSRRQSLIGRKKKEHASVITRGRNRENSRGRESTIWSLCFCLLRGGLPTRHGNVEEKAKKHPARRIRRLLTFLHRRWVLSLIHPTADATFFGVLSLSRLLSCLLTRIVSESPRASA